MAGPLNLEPLLHQRYTIHSPEGCPTCLDWLQQTLYRCQRCKVAKCEGCIQPITEESPRVLCNVCFLCEKDEAAAAEIARRQHTQTIMPINKGMWVLDHLRERCHCQKKFTLFCRRHHCRACGEVFCGDCVTKRPMQQGTAYCCDHCADGIPIRGRSKNVNNTARSKKRRSSRSRERFQCTDSMFGTSTSGRR